MFMGGVICFSDVAAQENVQKQKSSSTVMMRVEGGYRYISGYGIPRHAASAPEALGIKSKPYSFRVNSKPKAARNVTEVERGAFFGVSLDGVPFKIDMPSSWKQKPEWTSYGMRHDSNGGLVQKDDSYVYSAIPKALVSKDLSHVGYAADGFPVFVSKDNKFKSSYRLKEGFRPTGVSGPGGEYDGSYFADYQYVKNSGALDACNGMTVKKKYYIYVLTENFPRMPLCWSGTPDESFLKLVEKDEPVVKTDKQDGDSHYQRSLKRRGR